MKIVVITRSILEMLESIHEAVDRKVSERVVSTLGETLETAQDPAIFGRQVGALVGIGGERLAHSGVAVASGSIRGGL